MSFILRLARVRADDENRIPDHLHDNANKILCLSIIINVGR